MSDDTDGQLKFTQLMIALLGLLLFAVQIALSLVAPGFVGHGVYCFFILMLISVVAGCAGWASGVLVGHLQELSGFFDAWQTSA